MSNDIELIGLLLEAGGDIDASDVLAKAAGEEENFEILHFLIEQGADVKTFGVDALKNAISGGNIAAIKLLFKSGANITDRDHGTNCQTPLQFAVYSGELKIVPYLVKDGADVNAPPSRVEGRIALHETAARKEAGHRAIMQSIIAQLKADKVPGVNW